MPSNNPSPSGRWPEATPGFLEVLAYAAKFVSGGRRKGSRDKGDYLAKFEQITARGPEILLRLERGEYPATIADEFSQPNKKKAANAS